jgi:hypothetical protein
LDDLGENKMVVQDIKLTEDTFRKAESMVPQSSFNEIWCSQRGYEIFKKYILVEGTTVYLAVDYPSFIATPVKIKDFMPDNRVFLVKATKAHQPGTIVPMNYYVSVVVKLDKYQ